MNLQVRRSPGDRILELGGGDCPRVHPKCMGGQDLNVDVRICHSPDGRQTVDFAADFNKPLPINSEEWDGVFSMFAIEHISWRNIRQFVSEIYRVVKPGGRVVVISPDTEAQMRRILSRPEWEDDDQNMLFGNLDYPENSHKAMFNPRQINKLFTEVGFVVERIQPYGDLQTDMCLEAIRPANSAPSPSYVAPPPEIKKEEPQQKPQESPKPVSLGEIAFPKASDPVEKKKFVEIAPSKAVTGIPIPRSDPASLFDRHYFDGGTKVGGYPPPGYIDFPCHEITARHVLARKPESVLELGCGRGYVLKRIQDAGIHAWGVEVSKHACMTRVADQIIQEDLCKTPWKVTSNKAFDLCFSISFLEHVPEELIPAVATEMERVCKRGLHGVTTPGTTDGFDKTQVTVRSVEWWKERLPKTHEVFDKRELEGGSFPSDALISDGKTKVNVGSFITMFHRNWINLDIHDLGQYAQQNGYRYVRQDARQGLPFKTGEVDAIMCCHMLEHFSYAEGLAFLRECRRVIKPSGGMRIIVPDTDLLTSRYSESRDPEGRKSLSEFDEINQDAADSPTAASKLWFILGSGGHQAFYNAETLCWLLKEAEWEPKVASFRKEGFTASIFSQILRETLDIQPEISLFVDAVPSIE